MAYGLSMARGIVNARDAGRRGCDGVTLKGRICRHKADVTYRLRDGRVVGYCTQHDRGAGVNSMLKPFPWEIES